MKTLSATLIAAALACFSLTASAQWQWLDGSGRKVFSDQAPPPDVPEKNILKRPGGLARPAAAPLVAAPASAPASAATPRVSGKDAALQEKKKQAEAEAEAKQKAEEEKFQKTRADNCQRARQAKRTLDSGVRLGRLNDKGEHVFLDEAGRAAEAQRVDGVIATECQP